MVREFKMLHFFLYSSLFGFGGGGRKLIIFKAIIDSYVERGKNT